MGTTTPEYTGWRDDGLSRRHRLWGVEIQATDIDFIPLEYRSELGDVRPVAFVEYKRENAPPQYPSNPKYLAIGQVCARAHLPFFAVRYKKDYSQYLVVPLNDYAKLLMPERKNMTEIEYVTFMYRLRGYNDVPQKTLDNLRQLSENRG